MPCWYVTTKKLVFVYKELQVLHRQSEVILSGRNKIIWILEKNKNLCPNTIVLLYNRAIGSSIRLLVSLDLFHKITVRRHKQLLFNLKNPFLNISKMSQ